MFGVAFRRHRGSLLAAGVGCIIAADLILALAGNVWLVGAGAALWGLHMGATQGEGRPGIVRKPRKNNLAYCSETENEARAGFHRPALIN